MESRAWLAVEVVNADALFLSLPVSLHVMVLEHLDTVKWSISLFHVSITKLFTTVPNKRKLSFWFNPASRVYISRAVVLDMFSLHRSQDSQLSYTYLIAYFNLTVSPITVTLWVLSPGFLIYFCSALPKSGFSETKKTGRSSLNTG